MSFPSARLIFRLVIASPLLGASNLAFAQYPCQTACSCAVPCNLKCMDGDRFTACGPWAGVCRGGSNCRIANPDNLLDSVADARCESEEYDKMTAWLKPDESAPVPEAPKVPVEPAPAPAATTPVRPVRETAPAVP